jgi:hypothetical protein
MAKRDLRRRLTHGVSTHVTFGPIYWAKVEIVDADTGRTVEVITRDSRDSGRDAAEQAVAAAIAWIAENNDGEQGQTEQGDTGSHQGE